MLLMDLSISQNKQLFADYLIVSRFMGNAKSQAQTSATGQHNSFPLQQFALAQYGGRVLVDRKRGVIVKTFQVPVDQVTQFLKVMNRRKSLRHSHLAEFRSLEQEEVDQGTFCSASSHKYRLEYELLTHSLFNEIQRHCQLRQPVPEAEVCRIFEAVVECLDYLKKNNTLHGDVKVGSIFLDRDRNVKLVDSFMLKQGRTNYEVVLEDPKSMSLLSPEQLELLRIKLFDTLEGSSNNQIFMVGLTMLEVTTIREGMNCYNLDNLTINQNFFMNAMQDIQDCGYSHQLSNLIMNCVHKHSSQRPSFQQFLRIIRNIRTTFTKDKMFSHLRGPNKPSLPALPSSSGYPQNKSLNAPPHPVTSQGVQFNVRNYSVRQSGDFSQQSGKTSQDLGKVRSTKVSLRVH